MKKLLIVLALATALTASIASQAEESRIQGNIIPPECTVQSWCTLSATECFVPFVDHANGFSQAYGQFSTVRKFEVECAVPYSNFPQHRTIQGPVEPLTYRGEIFTNDEDAKTNVMSICNRYRTDWIAAAPACHN